MKRDTVDPLRIALVTRTRWDEPSRLRHQVARLLASRGHEVTFYEKGSFGFRSPARTEEGIRIVPVRDLIHHQLRIGRLITWADSAWLGAELAPLAAERFDVVLNFRYDCYVLRTILPETPIITIINDDFVSRARSFARREARRAFRRTVLASDAVLTVSYPLLRQALDVSQNAALFLPWARREYARPSRGRSRPAVLYWGYINDRLDWSLLEELMERGQPMHFVGPIERSTKATAVLAHPNATYHGVRQLSEIPDVVDECCCSILPYDLSRSHLEVTISNRAFDLLAHGLPLVYANYPELLAAPEGVMVRASSIDEYAGAIAHAREHFDVIQPSIERFLSVHTPDARYSQLLEVARKALRSRRP